jgi:hypothetical protein
VPEHESVLVPENWPVHEMIHEKEHAKLSGAQMISALLNAELQIWEQNLEPRMGNSTAHFHDQDTPNGRPLCGMLAVLPKLQGVQTV